MRISYVQSIVATRFLTICGLTVNLLLSLPVQAQSSPSSPQELKQSIDRLFQDSDLDNAFCGVKVVDLDDGTVLYSRNDQKSFVPASNQKLYTTAAALHFLGPDFSYQTELYTRGIVEAGVLNGDLIVRGSGDPVIGGRFNEGDLTEVFRNWAESLKNTGIISINGNIIGDDDVFDDVPLGTGWSWDDETYWYAAEISGLSFNDNSVDFTISPRREGTPAEISWKPFNTDYVQVINNTVTIPADSSLKEGYSRARGTNTIRIYSRVPRSRSDLESLTVLNPTLYFTHVFRETLEQSGISVEGGIVDVDDLSVKPDYDAGSMRLIATHASPPLSDIIDVINKKSHNLYAEQVLKTIAAEISKENKRPVAGSAETAIHIINKWLHEVGVDTTNIQMVDGSGLSHQNLTTPEATISLLEYMWRHPDSKVASAFYTSLPVGGQEGSLENRFTSGPAEGNVRAKTGTISNVSALSGYVMSAEGTPIAFSTLCNHFTVKMREIRNYQDALVNLLARYQR